MGVLLHRLAGIHLRPGKEPLVRARLSRRLRALGLATYAAYLDVVEREGHDGERSAMIDALTTNKTSFFREAAHFDFVREALLPTLRARRARPRWWSAACSSGEEPYSLAILLREHAAELAGSDPPILATDISTRMLEAARAARYDALATADVPRPLLERHFVREQEAGAEPAWRVASAVRALVRFERRNLMDPWPADERFDVIFCRNVMIYFDRPTQQRLVERMEGALAPGGHLFVGHAESMTNVRHGLRFVRPAVYVKR